MTKVLYLDFDGVINTTKGEFISSCIQELNRIVEETKCEIVISSMWRYGNTLPQLIGYLRNAGFKYSNSIVDVTPKLDVKHPETGFTEAVPCRGIEILAHAKMTGVDRWIAVDDMHDIYMQFNLVQTNYDNGLTKELADKAIEMLNT